MLTAMRQEARESATDQQALSSTVSSLSDTLDMTDSPRSLTLESSVESEDNLSRKTILNLSELWTEQSEKVP